MKTKHMVKGIAAVLMMDGVDLCVIDDIISNPKKYITEFNVHIGVVMNRYLSNYDSCIKELYTFIVDFTCSWNAKLVTVNYEKKEACRKRQELDQLINLYLN